MTPQTRKLIEDEADKFVNSNLQVIYKSMDNLGIPYSEEALCHIISDSHKAGAEFGYRLVRADMEALKQGLEYHQGVVDELSEIKSKLANITTLYECLKVTSHTEEEFKQIQSKLAIATSALEKIVNTNDNESCDEYQLAESAREALEKSQ